jgi:thiol-disulfide isomerase/thioredoxin
METMIKTHYSFLILLNVIISNFAYSQSNALFIKEVEECYENENFKDILYRFEHEKECYINKLFPKVALVDINGKTINNIDFKEKVVIINFWFTACPPCLEEIPEFNLLFDKFDKEKVLFLAPTSDNKEVVKKFAKQYGELKSVVIPNSNNLLRNTLSSKSGYPTTIVLNKNGVIVKYYSGGIRDFTKFQKEIELLIEKE